MGNRLILGVAAGALVLGVASTAALAAATLGRPGPFPASPSTCSAPPLPGAVVDVTATDMGAMMGGPNGSGGPAMMGPDGMGGPGGNHPWPMGMMRLLVNPAAVPAGPVSLRVTNTGWRVHEVVVLPLAPGQAPGQRRIGSDGKIDEADSLAEASNNCAAGSGEGIAPAGTGWTSLTLAPGRYELVCNIAGHYAAGMYAELDVTTAPK